MINYAIIGTPQGFKCEQWNYLSDNSVDAKQLADYIQSQLDIKTKLILPSKTAELFLFKTELKNGKKLDSFILYRGADEINTTRPGSFYGAAIIVLDREFISIESVIVALRELADIVKLHCIKNNRFIGNLSLADETLSTIPASIKRLSETSKQNGNNQAITNANNYPAKFFLVDELNVPLEQAAFKFYENIIKKYQQADIYFSSCECDTNLPLIKYPNSQATPPNKPKIPVAINFDNNDDNVLLTSQETNLFSDKRPNTPHHPRQNTAQSKNPKDTSTWVFVALIGTVLSLSLSVTTLLIVLSKDYSQNSNTQAPDLLELTKTINELKADIDKLKGELFSTKRTTSSSESQPTNTTADKLDTSPKEVQTEKSTPKQENIPPHRVAKGENNTDDVAKNICNQPEYRCSSEKLENYKTILISKIQNNRSLSKGQKITIFPEKTQ